MEEFSITGGARMGSFNATWPFTKLIVSADNLVLSVVFLGKYDFRPHDVICLERYRFIPLFQSGLRIVHSRSDYPPLVVFWTMGSQKKLLERIRNIGFSPSAPASSTVRGGRTWPKPQRATRQSH